ncbi:hypothetical protein C5167_004412 [Papaver somniferum]|uniref:Uncharacterized protein n=1 Tax=Papaver somniferum TaxID=3469 RepID=A0A4Y7JBJ7_PAPSO|nr:uncharacterized protein LOC113273440 [Papaver somniferum]RZC57109.1 hypothetical protein C5167_004412 [Papaver somniferum]
MVTSITLRSLIRRGFCTSSSALCSNCNAQIQSKGETTVTNPKKLVFNFKTSDDYKYVMGCGMRRIIESSNGDMSFVFKKTLKEMINDIIFQNKGDVERARGVKVTNVAFLIPPYINDYQKQIIMEAANDAGLFVESFITAIADNPFLNRIYVHEGEFGILLALSGVFDVPIKEFILSGDKSVSETILSELQKIRGYDLKQDPVMVQKIKEAVDRAMARMSSSNLKKTGIKLNLPVAADQPDESTTITWSID